MIFSFKNKIITVATILIILISFCLSYSLILSYKKNVEHDLKEKCLHLTSWLAVLVKQPLFFSNEYILRKTLDDFKKQNKDVIYILITDKYGQIIIDSGVKGKTTIQKELKKILKTKTQKTELIQKKIYNHKISVYNILFPIKRTAQHNQTEIIGYISLGLSLDKVATSVKKSKRNALLIILFGIIISFVILFFYLNSFTSPLKKLSSLIGEISQGNLDHWQEINAKNELGKVITSLKKMMSAIRKDIKERTNREDNFKSTIDEKNQQLKFLEKQLEVTDQLATIKELSLGLSDHFYNPLLSIEEQSLKINTLLNEKKEALQEKDNATILQGMTSIIKTLTKTKEIMDTLITLSNPKISLVPTDINKIIEEIIFLLHSSFEKKELVIDQNLSPSLHKINCDPAALEKILFHILNNAIQFTEEKGEIAIFSILRKRDEHDIAEIRIRDTGCGIPDKNLKKILLPFFTTEKEKRPGLGLSLSYSLVKALGGSLEVTSRINNSTTFVLKIPT